MTLYTQTLQSIDKILIKECIILLSKINKFKRLINKLVNNLVLIYTHQIH